MQKIKIGILGCANIAFRRVIPALKTMDEFELTAIASRDFQKAEYFAKEFKIEPVAGYENLLESDKIDAVYIPLPNGLHFQWIINSLEQGKHVICEKPIVTSYKEAVKVVELSLKKKKVLFENFMFLYHRQISFVDKMIGEGKIGSIRSLHARFGFPPFENKKNIRYSRSLKGGSLFDAGAYCLRASHHFLGKNLKVLGVNLNFSGSEVDVFGAALLAGTNGATSLIEFGFDNYYQNSIEIWGTEGKLSMDRAFTSSPADNLKVTLQRKNLAEDFFLEPDDHFRNIFKKFQECITEGNYDFQHNNILTQSKLLEEVTLNAQKQ